MKNISIALVTKRVLIELSYEGYDGSYLFKRYGRRFVADCDAEHSTKMVGENIR